MLKIEAKEGKVIVSGSSTFYMAHSISALIEELQKAQRKLIEEQEKKALEDNCYETWQF